MLQFSNGRDFVLFLPLSVVSYGVHCPALCGGGVDCRVCVAVSCFDQQIWKKVASLRDCALL